jgi:catechol 2,3-dioxygenase-like lactoylglutathione lyase family enzyme
MAVKRIIANIAAPQPEVARAFCGEILGLEPVVDHGWIATFAAPEVLTGPQVSIASAGGSGTAVPDLSIEVDDFDQVLKRVEAAGMAIEYGPQKDPWALGASTFATRSAVSLISSHICIRRSCDTQLSLALGTVLAGEDDATRDPLEGVMMLKLPPKV